MLGRNLAIIGKSFVGGAGVRTASPLISLSPSVMEMPFSNILNPSATDFGSHRFFGTKPTPTLRHSDRPHAVIKNRVPPIRPKTSDLVNENIKFRELLVIGFDGKPHGTLTLEEAFKLARSTNHDLMVVAKHEDPPVARIVDYQQLVHDRKVADEAHKKMQRVKYVPPKEIRFGASIEAHDLGTKKAGIIRLLKQGHPVKVVLNWTRKNAKDQARGKELLDEVVRHIVSDGLAKESGSRKFLHEKIELYLQPTVTKEKK